MKCMNEKDEEAVNPRQFITNKTKMIETNSILTENLGLVGGREPLDVVSHDVDHLTVLTAQRHHYD